MSYHTRPVCDFGKPLAKTYHAVMNFIAFVLAFSGIAVAFVNHQELINRQVPGKNHLSSFHSWCGFVGTSARQRWRGRAGARLAALRPKAGCAC